MTGGAGIPVAHTCADHHRERKRIAGTCRKSGHIYRRCSAAPAKVHGGVGCVAAGGVKDRIGVIAVFRGSSAKPHIAAPGLDTHAGGLVRIAVGIVGIGAPGKPGAIGHRYRRLIQDGGLEIDRSRCRGDERFDDAASGYAGSDGDHQHQTQ